MFKILFLFLLGLTHLFGDCSNCKGNGTVSLDNKEEYLKELLTIHLITDAIQLTNEYRDVPTYTEDIYNRSEHIKTFSENFMNVKTDKKAFNHLKEYLNSLLSLVKDNNLPEMIVVLNSKVNKYTIENDTFNIEILSDVKVDYYIPETKEWKNKTTTLKIEATGKFEKSLTKQINPLGVEINTFKVLYPTKRGN
ncbi:hypothetical protein [Aliarcobacter butzleri]|uniref:hypothetical protein n=1 Tax=Aliarcobacter butzleri TaxID=28197 RepID=UPI00126A5EA7|nr:hypothetical protein [Aliarcobacter butzleri]